MVDCSHQVGGSFNYKQRSLNISRVHEWCGNGLSEGHVGWCSISSKGNWARRQSSGFYSRFLFSRSRIQVVEKSSSVESHRHKVTSSDIRRAFGTELLLFLLKRAWSGLLKWFSLLPRMIRLYFLSGLRTFHNPRVGAQIHCWGEGHLEDPA